MNKLIAFSGIDSAGKSTQIEKLETYLLEKNSKVKVVWSRGGYTPLFNGFKAILRKIIPNSIPEPGESKHRDQTFKQKWVRIIWLDIALLDMMFYYCLYFRLLNMLGYTVIADRYLWDTYIDFKMMFPLSDFEDSLVWKTLMLLAKKPNHSIILTLDSEKSLRRSLAKNEPFMENITLRKKRINFYHNLILDNCWDKVIDGSRSINSIFKEIKIILDEN